MCAALALAVISLQRDDRRAQVTYAAMTTAATATLVATYSRSAWIGGMLGALITAAWVIGQWRAGGLRAPSRRVIVALGLVALIIAAASASSVVKRATPGSSINVVSDREHESTVRFAYHQFVDHPLLGIGPGGLGVKLKLPPRTYLSVAAQVGVFGLLALLAAAAITFGLLLRAYRSLRGTPLRALPVAFAGAYAGFLGANVTYDVWFDDFHWLMLGAIAGMAAALGSTGAVRARETTCT